MATPTIELVRPGSGWSAGGTLVEITGTGFRTRPRQPLPTRVTGPRPTLPPPVRVTFDGIPAPRTWVVSDTLLRCLTPRHPPARFDSAKVQVAFGTIDVTLDNVDDAGVPLAGESVTAPLAFSFVRPRLDGRGEWARILGVLVEHLRCLVLENVHANPSADFSRETGDFVRFVELAAPPGIGVTEIAFPPTELDAMASPEYVPAGDPLGHVLERRPPVAVDLSAKLVVVSDNAGELANLGEILAHVFAHASILEAVANPLDPSAGVVSYSILPTSPYGLDGRIGQINLATASQSIVIRRVLSSDLPGAPRGFPEEATTAPHEGTVGITMPATRITVGGAKVG